MSIEKVSQKSDKLMTVGKMKGELNGEFEMFYLAVDGEGQLFKNHNLRYGEKAYEKSEDWKPISRKQLAEYEKYLHFIPSRKRAMKR